MSTYSRNCVVLAKTENGLIGGSGAVITVGANTGGALPTGAATVTTAGTGYPANRTIEVWFQGSGGVNAIGRITTSGAGAILTATVDDGGSGYNNASPAAMTIVATANGSYGVYTAPATTDAVLVGTDFKIDPEVITVDRDVYTGSMGGKQSIPGEAYVQISFTIELAGSGAAITEAAWNSILKAAGAVGVLTPGVKWDYTPITDQFPSLSMRIFRSGYVHVVRGCRVAKIDFDFSVSTLPTAVLTLIGIDNGRQVAVNQPTPNLTAWKTPVVITDANTGDLRFGGTYSNATGAFTGGTNYGSKGLKLTWDNSAKFRPFLGGSGVPITNREVTGSFVLDLPPADNVAFYNAFKANSTISLAFVIGSVSGSILKLWMPAIERNNPGDEDDDGLALASYSLRARPSAMGLNDEIRIITM